MTKRSVLVVLSAVVAVIVAGSLAIWLYDGGADVGSGAGVSGDLASTSSVPGVDDRQDGYLPSMASKSGQLVKVTVDPYGKLLPQEEKPLSEDDPGWLSAPPKGLEWQTSDHYMPSVLGMSTSDGPTEFIGDVPAGFAHTPQGAVLAAIAINTAQVGGQPCRYAAEHFFYPASSPQKADEKCARYESLTSEDDAIPNAPTTAIEIRSYDGTSAAMYLWFLHPEEPRWRQYVRREEYVVWVDGQWKLDKRIPSGRKRLHAESIPTTATRWGDGK